MDRETRHLIDRMRRMAVERSGTRWIVGSGAHRLLRRELKRLNDNLGLSIEVAGEDMRFQNIPVEVRASLAGYFVCLEG